MLQLNKFTDMEVAVPEYGFNHKHWAGDLELDGETIPLQLTLTEYSGDKEVDQYFTIDIQQGVKKFHGEEFETAEEAIEDAEYRILELADSYELTPEESN